MTTPRFCPGKRDGQDKKLYYRLPLRKTAFEKSECLSLQIQNRFYKNLMDSKKTGSYRACLFVTVNGKNVI